MFIDLLLPLMIAIMLSLFVFWRLLKKFGLDPALINYSNLFTRRGFWVARIGLLFSAIAIFAWARGGQLFLAIIAFSFLWLIVVLMLFSRTPTQPTAYYAFTFLSAMLLALNPSPRYLVPSACLYISGELNLVFWRRNQKYIYDKWVAARAKRIAKKYQTSLAHLPGQRYFDVVHVATTEDIARPSIVRLAERMYFYIKRPAFISTGIMQVRDSQPISDQQSMQRGSKMLNELLDKMPPHTSELDKMRWISRHYNDSESYADLLAATLPGVKAALI